MSNDYFVKKNICPYCTYPCDSAGSLGKEKDRPEAGSISYCLMCCEPSIFDPEMNLVKFDLNSIEDLIERNRLKVLQIRMEEFWQFNPDKDGRRKKYLKIKDSLDVK